MSQSPFDHIVDYVMRGQPLLDAEKAKTYAIDAVEEVTHAIETNGWRIVPLMPIGDIRVAMQEAIRALTGHIVDDDDVLTNIWLSVITSTDEPCKEEFQPTKRA